jgi:hypothetical protein
VYSRDYTFPFLFWLCFAWIFSAPPGKCYISKTHHVHFNLYFSRFINLLFDATSCAAEASLNKTFTTLYQLLS